MGIEMFNSPEVPEQLIELIKEYIPLHTCIGTIWNKDRVVETSIITLDFKFDD
ncbi:hypothetical protein [Gelidibacter japonicus]|uniref:hypothetical protein n=1 Tax=Gelidibacter japonicus TaxID=1962232 RepID=UPI002AFF64FC|nr:hypothetical protein [Gelidibacter japonicus]